MASYQRPAELRSVVEDALGVRLNREELAILAGRLRFDDTPALSQQTIADRIGFSQPHVSNLERQLVAKLRRVAERRRVGGQRAEEIHETYEALMAHAEALGAQLPPKPLKVRRRKKVPASAQ